MKLFLTPPGGTELSLHDLGDIYVNGQSSAFTPEDFPQKETRTLQFRIEFNKDSYRENYSLLNQVRAAVRKQNCRLRWKDEDEVDPDTGSVLGVGEVYLDQTVILAAQNVPEVWGTYQQTIDLAFKWDISDISSSETHLQAVFKRTGLGTEINLGGVFGSKEDFKSSRFMEMKNIRDRSSGTFTLNGRWMAPATDTPKARRLALQSQIELMRQHVNGRDGTLTYGPSDNRFFDRVVKVDSFVADIDQATFDIKWSMTASYTVFPNEAGYAAADIKVDISVDNETGEEILSLQGTVAAATEQVALSKLDAVRTATLSANAFTAARRIRSDVEKGFLDTDDTEGAQIFTTLTFHDVYRRRVSDVLSFTFQQSDTEDTKTGLIRRGISGTVVASGATDEAAFAAAVAKAQDLGDNKYPFRLSSSITRNDRQVHQGPRENVGVTFNYEYELKGTRVFIEFNSQAASETFGDDAEALSGFVIAKNLATAQEIYGTQIRTAYDGRLVRGERTSYITQKIEAGQYGGDWVGDGTFEVRVIRFEFEFSVHKAKAAGFYAIKYGLDITTDYVRIVKEATCEGRFFASNAMLADAENSVAGNKLDAFLNALGLGNKLRSSRRTAKERLGDSIIQTLAIDFSCQFISALTSTAQLLECHVAEEIQYSGVRWNVVDIPDGVSIPQDVGITPGRRMVSGVVSAVTEAAAMAWIKKQHALPFPTGGGGGTAPSVRYLEAPKITRDWEFLPLDDGTARGSTNWTYCRCSFTFNEILPFYPYIEI